jgi:hypothetical protein
MNVMQRLLLTGLAAFALGLGACSNDPTVNPNGTNTTGANIAFKEVDRIGKPGIKELFLPFSVHSAYNQGTPENDPANYGPAVASFVTGTAGRSAAIGSFVSTLLLPDAMIADFNSTATRASYLGWETSGSIAADCTGLSGTTFGGRAPDDDVVDVDLGLAFGNLATSAVLGTSSTVNVGPTPPPADDGNEKNGTHGTPNLTNEHVACPSGTVSTAAFPYLAAPL